jgi:hypothetical protein
VTKATASTEIQPPRKLERQQLHSALHDALQLLPGQWPAVVDPDEGESLYPPDTAGFEWDLQAKALWRELERAAAA